MLEKVCLSRALVTWRGIWGDQFLQVDRGRAIKAFVGEQTDLVLNPLFNGKLVEGFEDGCDVVTLPHSHQDPGSTVLDVLQLLDVLAWDPDEKCIAVVQS